MKNKDFRLSDDERLDYINEDLSLVQVKNGLTFGTDAYLLSAFTKKCGGTVADLGSGTGVCSFLCLTRNKFERAVAYELQPRFTELISKNARLNLLSDRITVINEDVRLCKAQSFEAVISNPPYMKALSGAGNNADEKNVARRELNGTINDFCLAAARLLKFGGLFYTVYRPERLCDMLCSLRSSGLEPKKLVTVYPSISSKPCLVLCESKKGASSGITESRPLIIYNKNRKYTADMAKIYDTCSMEHMFAKEGTR